MWIDLSPDVILGRFRELKEALRREGNTSNQNPTIIGGGNTRWSRLLIGIIKLNSDATVRTNGSHLAVIDRDDTGKVLHIHVFKSDVFVPEVAELEAILKALQLAKSFEWS